MKRPSPRPTKRKKHARRKPRNQGSTYYGMGILSLVLVLAYLLHEGMRESHAKRTPYFPGTDKQGFLSKSDQKPYFR